MTDGAETPFAGLDPDMILAAVEALGLRADGRVLALNSFENRVYRVGLEGETGNEERATSGGARFARMAQGNGGGAVVVKFYRPGRWSDEGIREEHAFVAELAAADISVVAPLAFAGETLHRHAGYRYALFPLRGGHAPELGDRDVLRHLGRVLGRLHAVGAGARFAHRPVLDVEHFGHAPIDFLLDGDWLPDDLGENVAVLADAVLEDVEERFAALPDIAMLRLHGDCHPGNILWRDGHAHFVDLDDCLTGPAVQDLWMLAGRREDSGPAWRWLLEGYGEFRAFDRRELALVEPLRALRLLHYNGWIARRWHDPAFPAAFPAFATRAWWEALIGQLQEQLAAFAEPPVDPDAR
ncbi:serine/threonine protein kinase [Arenimonas composti]|uniref:Stress response kinase A n=1 Tax=Arenimonas composti TR7-09 = DSM 18010 TaxID=1121013 RepID=A0A091B7K7_9GAMM|nr:serine/threonine protein kinase [Arenimonas composti]KFN48643.1 hypothetical protein P873_14180 [Arenimonas composti TR7-09 = DSM 18010]